LPVVALFAALCGPSHSRAPAAVHRSCRPTTGMPVAAHRLWTKVWIAHSRAKLDNASDDG
jgi:hypothetical protein